MDSKPLRIDAETHKAIRDAAKENGRPVTSQVRIIYLEWSAQKRARQQQEEIDIIG